MGLPAALMSPDLRTAVPGAFTAQAGAPPAGVWFAPGRATFMRQHTD
jgi:hypothetical protein